MAIWGLFGTQNVGKTSLAGRLAPNALAVTTPGGVEHYRTTLLNGIGVSPRHVMPWAVETPATDSKGVKQIVYPIDAVILNLSQRYGTLQARYDALVAAANKKNNTDPPPKVKAVVQPLPESVWLDGAMVPVASAMQTAAVWITFPKADPTAIFGYTTVIIDDLKLIINASRAMWKVAVTDASGHTEVFSVDDINPLKRKEAGKEIGSVSKTTFMKWLDALNVKFPGVDFIITGHETGFVDHSQFGFTKGGMAWETKAGAPELAGYFLELIRVFGDYVDEEGNPKKVEARKKQVKPLLVRSPIERFSSAAASYMAGSAAFNAWITKDKYDVYSADDNDSPPAATIGLFIGGGKRSVYPFSYAGYEFIIKVVDAALAVSDDDNVVEVAKAEYEKLMPRDGLDIDGLSVWLNRRDWAIHEAWAARLARSRLHERLK